MISNRFPIRCSELPRRSCLDQIRGLGEQAEKSLNSNNHHEQISVDDAIASESGLTKTDSKKALDVIIKAIGGNLAQGDPVAVPCCQ